METFEFLNVHEEKEENGAGNSGRNENSPQNNLNSNQTGVGRQKKIILNLGEMARQNKFHLIFYSVLILIICILIICTVTLSSVRLNPGNNQSGKGMKILDHI